MFSSPCIYRDSVLVGSHAGVLVCCRLGTGSVVWQADATAPVYASPLLLVPADASQDVALSGWRVLFADIAGGVYIARGDDGFTQRWTQLPGRVFSSPVGLPTGRRVLVGCRDNGLYALQY